MTDAQEKKVIVKGLKKDPPTSVCADFRQTDDLIVKSRDKSPPRLIFKNFAESLQGHDGEDGRVHERDDSEETVK